MRGKGGGRGVGEMEGWEVDERYGREVGEI